MAAAIHFIDQNERDPEKFRANARKARAVLREKIYHTDRFKQEGLLHLCGNSHLDVVFLWTHAEFVRKLGRTHASTLRLMEQYPGVHLLAEPAVDVPGDERTSTRPCTRK